MWRECDKIKFAFANFSVNADMNELPIALSDENKDAPTTSTSGGEFVALLGLLGTAIVALLIWFFADGVSVLATIALAFLFACVVVIAIMERPI